MVIVIMVVFVVVGRGGRRGGGNGGDGVWPAAPVVDVVWMKGRNREGGGRGGRGAAGGPCHCHCGRVCSGRSVCVSGRVHTPQRANLPDGSAGAAVGPGRMVVHIAAIAAVGVCGVVTIGIHVGLSAKKEKKEKMRVGSGERESKDKETKKTFFLRRGRNKKNTE